MSNIQVPDFDVIRCFLTELSSQSIVIFNKKLARDFAEIWHENRTNLSEVNDLLRKIAQIQYICDEILEERANPHYHS